MPHLIISTVGTSLITNVTYSALPTPYVVQRTGARDRLVALTFDDGPDRVWTPQILSILEEFHVPGTFFVIGENGVQNRGLLERMVRDGFEIGNHSYTHPNMAAETSMGINLELNATRRLVEANASRPGQRHDKPGRNRRVRFRCVSRRDEPRSRGHSV